MQVTDFAETFRAWTLEQSWLGFAHGFLETAPIWAIGVALIAPIVVAVVLGSALRPRRKTNAPASKASAADHRRAVTPTEAPEADVGASSAEDVPRHPVAQTLPADAPIISPPEPNTEPAAFEAAPSALQAPEQSEPATVPEVTPPLEEETRKRPGDLPPET